jgi:glutamate synthase (NADPH/NADH) large chain
MVNNLSSSCGVGFVCSVSGQRNRQIVAWGIEAVKNLTHRGAVGGDGKTGDGAGIVTEIPRKLFSAIIREHGLSISHINNLAVGTLFLYSVVEHEIEETLTRYGFRPMGWRDVPTDDDALGKAALGTKPRIRQLLIDTEGIPSLERERKLFFARKAIEKTLGKDVCIPGISSKTIVYKGLFVAPQLDRFYLDLKNEAFESAFCIFHQRFSTNTLPEWCLAQPFRVLGHNGEINTLQGNRNWVMALEKEILNGFERNDRGILAPFVLYDESDSASLDKIIELLIHTGFSPEHAVNLCIPPVWEGMNLDADERAFFEYSSLLMSPWDGPAAIVFTDGDTVGAHLDRNGLRPLRYALTEDGVIVCGSEAGMIDLQGKTFLEKGRLGPGDTLSIDLKKGKVKKTAEILRELARRNPYRDWIKLHHRGRMFEGTVPPESDPDLVRKQIAFGYTAEELQMLIKTMAETGRELTFSMGDDTPIPPLAEKPQLLFRYFKQRFSQVTNPAIDPIRERMVMSLGMNLGKRKSFLMETPEQARRFQIESPLLCSDHLAEIEQSGMFKVRNIPITYAKAASNLSAGVAALVKDVADAVASGAEIIILSDRDISKDRIAIPSLLAVAASFHGLLRKDLAHAASLIIETGEARDVHHIACLIGFGASAICPYLAFQTINDLCARSEIVIPFVDAAGNFKKSLEDGFLKVISRHGISTINSYHGAQLFDVNFLNQDFVYNYFGRIPVGIESDGIQEIEDSLLKRHSAGFDFPDPVLDSGGFLRYKREGEWHAWGTPAVQALIKFIRSHEPADFKIFTSLVNARPAGLRHLLGYKIGEHLPLDEVESRDSILKRFVSGAMSVGALSPEAHETIAEACNRLGMRSNSGEGGEDPKRFLTAKNSAIKQVASGRFGVTPGYLASAREIEIKVAQGAKPGEGGHLPALKVDEYIAGLRYCKPGTLLISPPPHHDIYSIEDLNQLIHDLKQANPEARIAVKLVSEIGVGTVAAGVAKAYADIVQISGNEGGTGAAPLTSIKNVGSYWELGLLETQRVLIENGLRERIRVRIDGGLKTGKDVIIAALLGAEEFGFGTETMIATGCVMARQCHLNTCPTGVATQDPKLRSRFKGTVKGVMALFTSIAGEVREILAQMGYGSLDMIIGRTDLVTIIDHKDFPASKRIKLEPFLDFASRGKPLRSSQLRNDNPSPTMNEEILSGVLPSIETAQPIKKEYSIRNINRSIPVLLNYHIARRYGEDGLPPDTLALTFRGSAGQSFGAFNHKGVTLVLIGEANDYVGKGMHGGKIVIRPDGVKEPHKQVIMGNTVLYGATGGEFFAAGRAGERFCIRNSGATAVIEGAGQHLCEYMTRGEVVVLGSTGFNVGAGMTGGVLYILDEEGRLDGQLNKLYVAATDLEDTDRERLKKLIETHCAHTESAFAKGILVNFDGRVTSFKKVAPR